MVLMGFALSVQAQGDLTSKTVSWTPTVPVTNTIDYPVIKVASKLAFETTVSENTTELVGPLEPWMFQTEYLDIVYPSDIESWMLDDQHLSTDNNQVESWMKDPGYLSH